MSEVTPILSAIETGTMTVDQCTLTGNSAAAAGGAVVNQGTLTV